ncbi:MAG: sugar-binding protein [Verrucomicrobiota bacterium]
MMKIFSNIYFPGLIFARSARVWLWVLMTAGSVAAQDKPAADWTLSKDARVMRSPLGEPFTRLELDSQAGMASMNSPRFALENDQQARLALRFRTTVKSSGRDLGAWLLISYQGEGGKPMGTQFAVFGYSPTWREKVIALAPPMGAVTAGMQLRLQNQAGTFDVADLAFTTESVAVEPTPPATEEAYQEIASYTFNNDGTKPGMVSSGGTLPAVSVGAAGFPVGFLLPDAYCDSPILRYEVDVQFSPDFDSALAKDHAALFVLGRNMNGPRETNSMSLMLWGGTTIFSRLSSNDLSIQAQLTKADIGLKKGLSYETRARWDAGSLELWWNGEKRGTEKLGAPFLWPKKKTFWIGGESASASVFRGKILRLSLRVLKPKLVADFSGGNDGGYFFGAGPHAWGLTFPENNGEKIRAEYWITDETGKRVANKPTVAEQTAGASQINIPHLALGWYELHARLRTDGARREIRRSFVVCPPVISTEAALANPCGIQSAPVNCFPRVAQAGLAWMRWWLRWDDIEITQSQYHWKALDEVVAEAEKNGLKLYLNITGGAQPWQQTPWAPGEKWGVMTPSCCAPKDIEAWKRFLSAIGTRYKGRIAAYQIWNEPDAKNGFYPFEPKAYVSVLKASAEVLRAADPMAKIGLGGFAAGLSPKTTFTNKDSAWPAGAFYALNPQPYFDIVDCHFYSIGEPGQSWDRVREDVKAGHGFLQSVGEDKKPLWNSETSMYSGPVGQSGGWGNVPYLSESDQANELLKLHVQSLTVGVERTFWYGFIGDVGIVNGDLSPKAAYAAQAFLSSILSGAKFLRDEPASPNFRVYAFAKGQQHLTIAWTMAGRGDLAVESPGAKKFQAIDRMGNPAPLAKGSTTLFKMSPDPVYFLSDKPIQLREIVAMQPAQAGSSDAVTVKLFNPSKSMTTFKLALSSADASGTPLEVILDSGKKNELTLDAKSFSGPLELEVSATGGLTDRFDLTLNRPVYQRLSAAAGQPAPLEINRPEQLRIGAATIDLQNRILSPAAWTGPRDCSLKMQLVREGDLMKFSIDVADDHTVPAPADKPVWTGDGVEFFLDFGRHGLACDKFQPCISAAGRIHAPGDKLPPGFTATAQKTAAGYHIEGSFQIVPAMADEIGFDVAVDDADDAGGRKSQAFWTGSAAGANPAQKVGVLRVR